jgi:hypothetical protein
MQENRKKKTKKMLSSFASFSAEPSFADNNSPTLCRQHATWAVGKESSPTGMPAVDEDFADSPGSGCRRRTDDTVLLCRQGATWLSAKLR